MAVGWAALTAPSKHPANLLPAASLAMAWGAVESSFEMHTGSVPPQPERGPAVIIAAANCPPEESHCNGVCSAKIRHLHWLAANNRAINPHASGLKLSTVSG